MALFAQSIQIIKPLEEEIFHGKPEIIAFLPVLSTASSPMAEVTFMSKSLRIQKS